MSDAKKKRQNEDSSDNYMKKAKIVLVIFAVLAVIAVIFNSNILYNKVAAVTINGTKYTVADYNYYYVTAYNSYYQNVADAYGEDLAQYFMPSTDSSFSEQVLDSETGQTWEEYLAESALETMIQMTAIYDDAIANGFTLSDDDEAAIDSQISSVEYMALYNYGLSFDTYLSYMYGEGMTQKVFRRNIERVYVASTYASEIIDGFTYTDEQLDEKYAELADSYDYITYRYFSVYPDEELELDEAFGIANSAAAAKSEEEFGTTEIGYLIMTADDGDEVASSGAYTTQGAYLPSSISEWLLDSSRGSGDTTVIEIPGSEEDEVSGYYAVMFLERDDNNYKAVNGSYILAQYAQMTLDNFDTEEEYTAAHEEDMVYTEEQAREIYEAMLDGTYESYSDVISADIYETIADSGEISDAAKNDLPNAESVKEWFFSEEREEGDIGIVEADDGWYILTYSGSAEETICRDYAKNSLQNDDFSAWQDEKTEGYTASEKWTKRFAFAISAFGG